MINQIKTEFQKFSFKRNFYKIEIYKVYSYYEQYLHQYLKYK